jgi:hypothetical protein
LIAFGGINLTQKYNGFMGNAIATAYPEYEWLQWKFSKNDFWEDPKNHRKFLDWVAQRLKIKSFEDWYKLSQKVRNSIEFLFKKLRIFTTQEVVPHSTFITTDLPQKCLKLYSQNMNGYHGDLDVPHKIIGMTKRT